MLLAKGFTYGFRIPSSARATGLFPQNLLSVRRNPQETAKRLRKELALGRMAGPFDSPPLARFIASPLGLIPKSQPGEFRLIHHLSSPTGRSINEGIEDRLCRVHYATFDQAVELVKSVGQGAYMAKTDIKSAFRLLPVHPGDFRLLGFSFEGFFFFDKCLPMGCSISCSLFEKFSSFLEFLVREQAPAGLVTHYLDDFLFIGRDRSTCGMMLTTFQEICGGLGVPLAPEKTMGPVPALCYLGLEIDAAAGLVRVPRDKLEKLKRGISGALGRRRMTLREIQSLVGLLNFVCKAVPPGRPFLRRLIDLTVGVKQMHHKVRVGKGARADLVAWSTFLWQFNGASIFLDSKWWESPDLELYTDAAASLGFGGYFSGKWFQGRWSADFRRLSPSIAACEFVPIVVAIVVWGKLFRGRRVLFWSDNQAVVTIINKQTSKCPIIMGMVRRLVIQCLKFNILFKAKHVCGTDNNIADALSRFQMERFRALAPLADAGMSPLPELPWIQ